MISNNKKVFFVKYQQDVLWYKTECGFPFPVPLHDTGEVPFLAEDKAALFMRWIKKQIDAVKNENVT